MMRHSTKPGWLQEGSTTWFGQYEVLDGAYYALPFSSKVDGSWSFDRGTGPFGDPDRIENGEGWRAVDHTENEAAFFRAIDETLDLDGALPPILYGERSLWGRGRQTPGRQPLLVRRTRIRKRLVPAGYL